MPSTDHWRERVQVKHRFSVGHLPPVWQFGGESFRNLPWNLQLVFKQAGCQWYGPDRPILVGEVTCWDGRQKGIN